MQEISSPSEVTENLPAGKTASQICHDKIKRCCKYTFNAYSRLLSKLCSRPATNSEKSTPIYFQSFTTIHWGTNFIGMKLSLVFETNSSQNFSRLQPQIVTNVLILWCAACLDRFFVKNLLLTSKMFTHQFAKNLLGWPWCFLDFYVTFPVLMYFKLQSEIKLQSLKMHCKNN